MELEFGIIWNNLEPPPGVNMELWLSSKKVAELEGVTQRLVNRKVSNGEYNLVREKTGCGRGGKQHEIHLTALAPDIQRAYREREEGAPVEPPVIVDPLDQPQWALDEMQRRLAILQAWEAALAAPHYKRKSELKQDFCAAHDINAATLYRWEAAYREKGAAGLMPSYPRERAEQRRLTPDLQGKIRDWWLTPKNRTVKVTVEMLEQYCQQTLTTCPGYHSIAAYCRDISESEKDLHQKGESAWRAKHEPTVKRNAATLRTLEIVCGDHRQIDILCKLKIRENIRGVKRAYWVARAPWLTLWLDLHSWAFVGHHVAWSPSSETIALALRDCLINVGVPESLYVDCGKDYRAMYLSNKRMQYTKPFRVAYNRDTADFASANHIQMNPPGIDGILDVLDIPKRHAQAVNFKAPFSGGVPRAKPIESSFNWFIDTEHEFPGWRSNSAQTMPEATRKLIAHIDDSTPLPTIEDVAAAIKASIAEHNARSHGDREMAAREYLSAAHITRLPESQHKALNVLLWPIEKCKVWNSQIYVNNAPYMSPELAKWGGETLTARFDPANMERVIVMTRTRPSEFVCVAENQDMRKMSWHPTAEDFKEFVVKPRKEAKHAMESIAEAYETLQSSDAELLQRGQRQQTRAAVAPEETPPPKPRGGKRPPKIDSEARPSGLQNDGKTYLLSEFRERKAGTAAEAVVEPTTARATVEKVLPKAYHEAAAAVERADRRTEVEKETQRRGRMAYVGGRWVANG